MNKRNWLPEKLAELKEKFPQEFPTATDEMILPLKDPSIDWDDFSTHNRLTCVSHRMVRYTTKNPWCRSIFMLQGMNGLPEMLDQECECPFSDLRAVKETEN